jgi:hypothetical protein
MVIHSFQQMIKEYDTDEIDIADIEARNKLLLQYPFSVIFEGDFLETDTVKQWLENNNSTNPINYLFYGKLGYDYGFFEFFFSSEKDANDLNQIIPDLFTCYPTGKNLRTNGYNEMIEQK